MKINVSRHELQRIRDIIWQGKCHYEKGVVREDRTEMVKIGNKLIKKVNGMLKQMYGHDCNGKNYLNFTQTK